MSTRSTPETWGSLARALHWLSAVVIITGLGHGYWMANILPRGARLPHYAWHATIFLYFGLLLALRIAWRLADAAPAPPAGSAAWERIAARAGHLALYALLVWLTVTGYMNWSAFPARFDPQRAGDMAITMFGLPVPALHRVRDMDVFRFWEGNHAYAAWALAALVLLHIGAALRHHFMKHNDVLSRMWSGRPATSTRGAS